jgi:hypothetical protein
MCVNSWSKGKSPEIFDPHMLRKQATEHMHPMVIFDFL